MISYFDDMAVFHADTCKPLSAAAEAGDIEMRALARGDYPGDRLPANTMRELKTVGYWNAPRVQNFALDWHRNEGIEFAFLSHGRVEFAVEEQEFDLAAGSLTITRPWQRHRVGWPALPASRMHWLILDVGVRRPNQKWEWPRWLVLSSVEIAELTMLLQSNEQPVWRGDGRIADAFAMLAELVSQNDDPSLLSRLKLQINVTLLEVLSLLRSQRVPIDAYLSSSRRTVSIFLDNLSSSLAEPWTLDLMAQNCGLGRTQFARYCVEITNASPMGYLTSLRIKRARELLGSGLEPRITDIAALCGFETSQYFAARFRREVGTSPREYRSLRRSKAADHGVASGASSADVARQ